MQKLRFKTKVSDKGTIQLPEGSLFENKEVEVDVVIIPQRSEEKQIAKTFIEKWAGFLSSAERTDPKLDYLIDKYHYR